MPSPKNVTWTFEGTVPGLWAMSCSSTDAPVRPEVNHHWSSARGMPVVVE